MPRGRPVDPETRARVVAMLLEPNPVRNRIARECGVAGSTVTLIAREEGVEFDRAQTELALQAKTLDMKAARQRIAAMLLIRAQEAIDSMDEPVTYFELSKDGSWVEYEADGPTIADRQRLVTIAGIATQRHADLLRLDATPETTAQESVVATMISGLEAMAAAIRARAAAEGTPDSGDAPSSDPDSTESVPASPAGTTESAE